MVDTYGDIMGDPLILDFNQKPLQYNAAAMFYKLLELFPDLLGESEFWRLFFRVKKRLALTYAGIINAQYFHVPVDT